MLRNEKEAVIAEVAQLLTDTENMFVSDYRGLTVAELAQLRGKQAHFRTIWLVHDEARAQLIRLRETALLLIGRDQQYALHLWVAVVDLQCLLSGLKHRIMK